MTSEQELFIQSLVNECADTQLIIDSSTIHCRPIGETTESLFRSCTYFLDNEFGLAQADGEEDSSWEKRIRKAERDLAAWKEHPSGTLFNDAKEVANAFLLSEVAGDFEQKYHRALLAIDGLHAALIADALYSSGLFERMQDEGKRDRKFALAELESRLGPAITSAKGASDFYLGSANAYDTLFRRMVLGEQTVKHLVSQEQALLMAQNLRTKLNAHYILAETSAAPSQKPARSGEKPRVFVCDLIGGNRTGDGIYAINTPLRTVFTAMVREIMYHHLHTLYFR